jgi:hypothetical protein
MLFEVLSLGLCRYLLGAYTAHPPWADTKELWMNIEHYVRQTQAKYLMMKMSHIGFYKTSIRKRKAAVSCVCFHITTLANEATDEVFTSEFKADYNAVVSALGKLNRVNWCGLIFAICKSLERWGVWTMRSHPEPFNQMVRTLKTHVEGVTAGAQQSVSEGDR